MAPEFYTNNCEGAVAPGTNWTTANQGASGDALVVTRTGGTIYTTTTAGEYIHGTQSVKLTPGGVFTHRLAYPLTTGTSANGRCYFRLSAAPGADASLVTLQGSTGACATVKLSSTNSRIRLENAAGITPTGGSPATALTYSKVYGLDVICTPGTSTADGMARLVVYNADGTIFADTGDLISNFFRSGVVTEVRFGVTVDYTVVADSFTASNAYVLAGPVINTATVPFAASIVAAGTVTATGVTGTSTAPLTATIAAAGNMSAASGATLPLTATRTAVGAVTAGLTRSAVVPLVADVTAAGNVSAAQGAVVALTATIAMTRNMAAAQGATVPIAATVVALSATSGHAEIAGISGTGSGIAEHGYAEIAEITGGATSVTPPATGSGHAEIAGISGLSFLPTGLQARAGADFAASAIKDVVLDGTLSTGSWATATWAVVSDSRVPRAAPYPTTLAPIELSPDTDALITVNFPAYPDTYTVVCQLTISDGLTISVDTVTVTVWAWIFWRKSAGKLVPVQHYRVVPTPPSPATVAFTSARVQAQLYIPPPTAGWSPNIGPMTRPSRGSDPRVGNGQLNIVWYEDLYVAGDTLSAAMARLTTPAVISFPEGRFVTSNFATNGSLYATLVPSNCLGIWGSGRGSVGASVGTIFSMVPNSSTRAGNVPAQDNSTPVQMRNMMHIGATGTELSYGQFHVEGVDQGHIYHNFTIYAPPGKVTLVDILSNGHYGNNGAPPGETFGIEILGNNNNLTDPSVIRCEVDGRRTIGGPNYGAVGLDYENLVRGSWVDCYAHHTNFASTVCFQSFNITSSNMICGSPSDTDGVGVDGRNAGGWMNHERTSGCVHTNPTLYRVFKNIGKSVHITHSNDTYTRGGFSSANGTLRVVNPTFNDIWGDNSLYIQSWHPYWTGCSMVGVNNTGIPAAPFAVNTDGSPLVKYKYVHTPGNGGFTVPNGFQPGQKWNSFASPATTPGPIHAFTP